MAQTESLLTTTDNPYDPFESFDEWYAFDSAMGYHTPSFLARVAVVSDEQTDVDQLEAIERAIDEIVAENVNGKYKKVTREIPNQTSVI